MTQKRETAEEKWNRFADESEAKADAHANPAVAEYIRGIAKAYRSNARYAARLAANRKARKDQAR